MGIFIPSLHDDGNCRLYWYCMTMGMVIFILHDDENCYTNIARRRELPYLNYATTRSIVMPTLPYIWCTTMGITIPILQDDGNQHTHLTQWWKLSYQYCTRTGIVKPTLHGDFTFYFTQNKFKDYSYNIQIIIVFFTLQLSTNSLYETLYWALLYQNLYSKHKIGN